MLLTLHESIKIVTGPHDAAVLTQRPSTLHKGRGHGAWRNTPVPCVSTYPYAANSTAHAGAAIHSSEGDTTPNDQATLGAFRVFRRCTRQAAVFVPHS